MRVYKLVTEQLCPIATNMWDPWFRSKSEIDLQRLSQWWVRMYKKKQGNNKNSNNKQKVAEKAEKAYQNIHKSSIKQDNIIENINWKIKITK